MLTPQVRASQSDYRGCPVQRGGQLSHVRVSFICVLLAKVRGQLVEVPAIGSEHVTRSYKQIWHKPSGAVREIQRMIVGRAVTGLDVRLPCTYRVNAGAKAHPHPREVT